MSPIAIQRIAALKIAAARRPHGTRARYIGASCRCMLCRAANSRYQCSRDARRRTGDFPDGNVSAETARLYILRLRHKGIGYKAVADAASVARSIIAKILRGERLQIRASTEQRILACDSGARADGALVYSAGTWKLIDELLARGYSKAQLARWLGRMTPSLQLNRPGKITARNASAVERMYRLIEAGKLARA